MDREESFMENTESHSGRQERNSTVQLDSVLFHNLKLASSDDNYLLFLISIVSLPVIDGFV